MKTTGMPLTAIAVFCLLNACSKEEAIAPTGTQATAYGADLRDLPCLNAGTELVGHTWMLNTMDGKRVSVAEGATWPRISFDRGEDGALTGSTGCNTLIGSYLVDCERIHLMSIGHTKMHCQNTAALEEFFLAALRATDSFQVNNEVLTLYNHQRAIATFRSERTLMVGPEWN